MIAYTKLKDEQADSEITADLLRIEALVDFSDQTTKIYHQGASMVQPAFEQPCGGRHTFEHRDEMRWDRI